MNHWNRSICGRRAGATSLEAMMGLTLLSAVLTFATPLIVRHGRLVTAQRNYRLALDEVSNQLERLRVLPGASHIALVGGDFDVLLLVHTPDNRALRELVLTRLQAIPEVLSSRTLLVFEEEDLEPEG